MWHIKEFTREQKGKKKLREKTMVLAMKFLQIRATILALCEIAYPKNLELSVMRITEPELTSPRK